MLKKALATAATAAIMVGAGAGVAAAAPAGDELPDTTDICNAPTVDNPEQEDSWVGVLEKDNPVNQVIGSLLPGVSLIAGVCNSSDIEAEEEAPAEEEEPGNSDQAPGQDPNGPGNSENAPGHGGDVPGQGDGTFPALV